MFRAGLLAMVLIGGACSKKSDAPGSAPAPGPAPAAAPVPAAPASEGSAHEVKVVKLTWKTPEGDPLLALAENGTLDGPCGPIGKVSGPNVVVGAQTYPWTGVTHKGNHYSMAKLPWTIELAPGGAVSVTQAGKPPVPLGTVTGADTEDGATLFAALVIAAPLMQINLDFIASDATKYNLAGSADSVSWRILAGGAIIKQKHREDPDPKVLHPITEAPDGTVTETATKRVLGKLVGRKACKPHDKAVTALIETYLAR